MKLKDLKMIIKANPAAARDCDTITEARKAIKERRKAGYAGKGYDLAPTFGGKRVVSTQSRKELPAADGKLSFRA